MVFKDCVTGAPTKNYIIVEKQLGGGGDKNLSDVDGNCPTLSYVFIDRSKAGSGSG